MDLLFSTIRRINRFQLWFDDRFGWFFTNGMKARRSPERKQVRA